MMKFAKCLLVIGFASLNAGCVSSYWGCEGFSALRPKGETARFIVKNDPDFAGQVIGHNKFGEKVCKWTP